MERRDALPRLAPAGTRGADRIRMEGSRHRPRAQILHPQVRGTQSPQNRAPAMADRSQQPGQIMEHQTRFDLSAALQNWREELAAQPDLTAETRRELETHVNNT